MAIKKEWLEQIKNLPAIEIFNQGTLEMYHGGVYSTPDTYCGACWEYLVQNDIPGQRIIDWDKFEEDIEEILNALDHYGSDKKHKDYIFLSSKLTAAKAKKIANLREDLIYSELEITCLGFEINGNRLEIPKDFFIHNYNEVKQIMKNFEGKYSKNGFEFPYPAEQVLERIRNKETTNLKKTFQFYGTPEKLCKILCEHAFDPYENKKLKILEPSAGQGAIIDSVLDWFKFESVHCEIDSITAIEYMTENYQVLQNKYHDNNLIKLKNMDFLEYDKYINYFDIVIANPPFSNGQDIQHFMKMFEVCKPGGIIVSIMSNGFIYNSQKKFQKFRDFIGLPFDAQTRYAAKGGCEASSENGDLILKTFESGEFKESGTNVHTVMIAMRKNTISGFENKKDNNEQLTFGF